jgi:peptidoglycan hydrolase-like protein with peptidoglycan-binding domain
MTKLSFGDRSQAVLQLQKALNAHGAKLFDDGDFGDATETAVRAYQLKVGLVAKPPSPVQTAHGCSATPA